MPAQTSGTATTSAPAVRAPSDVLKITMVGNRIASNACDVNPYEIRNSLLMQEEKARVRYKNGLTLPTSVEVLFANALRKDYNHRRTLSRNIVAASQPRQQNACAHHIVALQDPEANESRTLLFNWGIGINDADNGVFLPSVGSRFPDYPDATHHTPHHRVFYHLEVYRQLSLRQGAEGGRTGLRYLKSKLLSGALSL